jgi:hypothetical protein
MAVDLDHGKDVAKELAANVVPYLAEITAAHQWLEEETGFFFRNGDADAIFRHPLEWRKAYPLSPADIARTARILESSFEVLEESEKRELRRYAGWITQVILLDTPGNIQKEGERRMYLPASEAGRFWRWILNDIRPRGDDLGARERARKQTWNNGEWTAAGKAGWVARFPGTTGSRAQIRAGWKHDDQDGIYDQPAQYAASESVERRFAAW